MNILNRLTTDLSNFTLVPSQDPSVFAPYLIQQLVMPLRAAPSPCLEVSIWTGTAKILNIWQYMIMLQWFMRQMIIDKHWNYVFLMIFADFWWCLCAYLMLIHNFRTRPLNSGWDVTVSSSLQRGIRRFYECGPGHSLKVHHACCKQQLVLQCFT